MNLAQAPAIAIPSPLVLETLRQALQHYRQIVQRKMVEGQPEETTLLTARINAIQLLLLQANQIKCMTTPVIDVSSNEKEVTVREELPEQKPA